MEFKFNFGIENKDTSLAKKEVSQSTILNNDEKTCKKLTAKMINFEEVMTTHWKNKNSSKFYEIEEIFLKDNNTISLDVVTPCENSTKGTNPDGKDKVIKIDLIPDVYEGGFKIWECTLDLVQYIEDENVPLKEKRILDLGCGVGVLGSYAFLYGGAAHVTFQDYNENVLSDATIPTLIQNFEVHPQDDSGESCCKRQKLELTTTNDVTERDNECKVISKDVRFLDDVASKHLINLAKKKTSFLAGDWSHLADVFSNELKKYDIILTAETIYNVSCYPKLHDFLLKFLSSNGVVYMGSKSHYFGVGGSVLAWLDFVKSKNVFEIEIVQTIEDHLKRHIVRMKFKK